MRFNHDVDVESFRQEVRQFINKELAPEKERLKSAAQEERTNEEEYDYVSMTKAELVELAKERGLLVSGTKKKIIARLEEND